MPRITSQASMGADDAAVECALLLTNPFHEGFILGNQDAADDIAVAAKIFGHRVHDDIDAEIQGLLVVGRAAAVVDVGRHMMFFGDFRDGFEINDGENEGGGAFEDNQGSFRPDCCLQLLKVRSMKKGHGHMEFLGTVSGDEILQRPVSVVQADDMAACAAGGHDGSCAGGHAGSEGEGHGSVLQLRDFPLHDMGCRVGFPPVNEAVLLVIVKVEIRLKIREHMKRVHENRRNHSSEIFLVLVAGVGDSEKIVHVHLCLL